jgi:putative ABC transport system substrate-binding protein
MASGIGRRQFISILGGAAFAWPLAARAQQSAMPVIGYLGVSDSDASAFRQGLGEAGFVEGKTISIEYRLTRDYSRMPDLAAELIQRHVAIIATASTQAALAAKTATTTIPIVFAIGDDPVKFGLVAAINHPGGNVTGVNLVAIDLEAKRLGTLRELVPDVDTIAVLVNPKNPSASKQSSDIQDAARTVERKILILNAEDEQEIEGAFTTLVQQRIGALAVAGDTIFAARRNQIVTLAARYSIPTIYQRKEFAEVGGLISYGTDYSEMVRQQGLYVARILKGERAADLPVMQSTKFELVINLKTAKALGLTVPQSLLVAADKVIE